MSYTPKNYRLYPAYAALQSLLEDAEILKSSMDMAPAEWADHIVIVAQYGADKITLRLTVEPMKEEKQNETV